MGSNIAENHPVGFQWVMEARLRGATVIHVDPRFTRTSANASFHVPIRSGSDIAFLGAIVNYILENERWFEEYVVHYTNAATVLRQDYRDTEDQDGYFSGWDPEQVRYDPSSWQYEGQDPVLAAAGNRPGRRHTPGSAGALGGQTQGDGERDPTLRHPRCVFQVLKRHFHRYTPDLV